MMPHPERVALSKAKFMAPRRNWGVGRTVDAHVPQRARRGRLIGRKHRLRQSSSRRTTRSRCSLSSHEEAPHLEGAREFAAPYEALVEHVLEHLEQDAGLHPVQ